MDKVTIYTDGACSGNPGPGGWGAILMSGESSKEISGGKKDTTNNIMELTAVIEALKLLKRPCQVDLYSDSAYVVNAFLQDWISSWIKNNWINSSKEEVKNKELWQELVALTETHYVIFHKVKGHSNNKYNNRCDELARNAIKDLD
ncbi:MAG: ribonuclease HI [Clostridia bacterium]|nr:ribonuclease HI [Clostridia bacterium]